MIGNQLQKVYIDPSSKAYYEDRLFDYADPVLNREDTLAPFIRLRQSLALQGVELHTADSLMQKEGGLHECDYYSLGMLNNYNYLRARPSVALRAFVVFEPPVVDPRLYQALPELTAAFESVYVHNIEGDGYSLVGVDQSKLRKLYWPQPYGDVILNFWNYQDRQKRIVMINGNHKPASYNGELYSKRIEALVALSEFGTVDLYGRGWDRWWSRSSMWLPYWRHLRVLMSIYKGPCKSKYKVLSKYDFALCFENMSMKGYVTEKIFDCLYAGTIPLYLGAKDISDLIPEGVYIDCRKFSTWAEMHAKVMQLSVEEIKYMRTAGREFIQSERGTKYYNSLENIFNDNSRSQ